MSRQARLPPRCPFQKKIISPTPHKDNEFYPRHHKSSSQSFIPEEQPAWLDDLLNDAESNPKGIFHRRSASDSVTLLDGIGESFPSLNPLDDDNDSFSNENGVHLEGASVYGPNSPRRRRNLTFSENAIVSALSERVAQDFLQNTDGDLCISGISQSGSKGDACGSLSELNAETKSKRQSGQRSRVRKIQYIAELERTVEFFQSLESELAARASSLLQQRVSLSLENCSLKQQVAIMQRKKLIVEDQYQWLKKEIERLKTTLRNSTETNVRTCFGSIHAAESSRSEANWQMLDMGKLNLN